MAKKRKSKSMKPVKKAARALKASAKKKAKPKNTGRTQRL